MPIKLAENAVVAGRFKLNRLIGRGGMGSVWQATHLGLDIPCAVKFIEGELSHLAEAQTRFEREAKAAAQLRSPNVVQILDHGVYDGTPYIAMELLDGEDLGKRLARQGRMHPREVCAIIVQVTRALSKAHGLGIVHRDLKPDNIFLVRDDDREIAKVLDFGIAKSSSATTIEGSNTKTGAMLGTPYYMSPEQAQGVKTVDFRSDLWSLAVIVYQCITGVLPFESEALGDLLVKIIVQPLPVPSRVAFDVPPGFDAWWARASARDPDQRFQGARELADSLQLALGVTSSTDASHGRLVAGMTPAPARTPPGFGVTPANPAGTAPAFAATTGGGVAHGQTGVVAPTGPARRGLGIAIAAGATVAVVGLVAGALVLRGHGGATTQAAAASPIVVSALSATSLPPPVASASAAPPASAAVISPDPAVAAPPPAAAPPPSSVEAESPKHAHHVGAQPAKPPAASPASPAKPPAAAPPTPPKAPGPKPNSQDLGF